MGAREAAEIAFHGTRVVPATPEGDRVSDPAESAADIRKRLSEIDDRRSEAIPEPWDLITGIVAARVIGAHGRQVAMVGAPDDPDEMATARFVAASRADVKWLVSLAEALMNETDRLSSYSQSLAGQLEALKAQVYDADQEKDQASKDADTWHLAYDTLCSDLAYEMGMDSPSIAGDHQVKARVKELVAESARSYSEGVEDMRAAAMRIPATIGTQDLQSMRVVYEQIRDVSLTDAAPAPAPRDTHLTSEARALVKRYGAPAVAAEAARLAQH